MTWVIWLKLFRSTQNDYRCTLQISRKRYPECDVTNNDHLLRMFNAYERGAEMPKDWMIWRLLKLKIESASFDKECTKRCGRWDGSRSFFAAAAAPAAAAKTPFPAQSRMKGIGGSEKMTSRPSSIRGERPCDNVICGAANWFSRRKSVDWLALPW